MDTLAPVSLVSGQPILPVAGSTALQENFRLLETPFGDGYVATSPDGSNMVRGSISLAFSQLWPLDHAALVQWFRDRAGRVFLYQLPGEPVPRKWVCKGLQTSWPSAGIYSLVAQIEERFTL